jgi:hypothetical protein
MRPFKKRYYIQRFFATYKEVEKVLNSQVWGPPFIEEFNKD